MKQVPPLERARDLFALASSEYMFSEEIQIQLVSVHTHQNPIVFSVTADESSDCLGESPSRGSRTCIRHLQAESESLQKSEHNLRSFSRITYANSVLRLSSIGV
jgi:hypothetical protein